MPIQKIKSGRVITVTSQNFVGEHGMIFYDEELGDLRLGDGYTPGGRLLNFASSGSYVLPTASTSTLGGIKVGTNLTIDNDGVLSATSSSSYVLPTASTSTLGGIKVGSNLTITPDGVLSATSSSSYVLPTATTSTLGGIKVGSNLTITPDGTLNANTSTANSFNTIVTTGSSNLVASGSDFLEFIAGPGVSITNSATSTPYKSITINAASYLGNIDGGWPDTQYGGTLGIDGGNPFDIFGAGQLIDGGGV